MSENLKIRRILTEIKDLKNNPSDEFYAAPTEVYCNKLVLKG